MSPDQAAIGEFHRTIAELSTRLAQSASALAQALQEKEMLEKKYDALMRERSAA